MTLPLWFFLKLSSQLMKGRVQSMCRLSLNKQTLLAETGLDIVCGPLGELCACYHNGFQLGLIQLEIADRDFVSCWLEASATNRGY